MAQVGIMQGRLSPPQYNSIQSFPADSWREEFPRAREAGLACIEWIYEARNEDRNPLRTNEGVDEIRALADHHGVGVWSICADYYMERLLVQPDGAVDEDVLAHLLRLIGQAKRLCATYIVLPFVDASSLNTLERVDGAVQALGRALPHARAAGIELHLETDLPPDRFSALLARLESPWIKANYDIGNSASLGYEPDEELVRIGPYLGSVHVKDRMRGGSTVPLTTGDADFRTCFRRFRHIGFDRWFILQAAREDGLSETDLASSNRRKVEAWVAEASGGELTAK
jgi:hexulose-6-phosphate isomerase